MTEPRSLPEPPADFYDDAPPEGMNGHAQLRVDQAEGWRDRLLTSTFPVGDGKFATTVQKSLPNAITILRYHEAWRGILAWDAFAERIVTSAPPPWDIAAKPSVHEAGHWRETDTGRTVDWLAREENLAIKPTIVEQAVAIVAEANATHPVQRYLRSLRWDGVQRLPTWLATYCGADSTPYASEVGRRWLISAVARPLVPGCQVDCVLILESREQGTGKSSAFRALVPDASYFSETGITIGEKDSYQGLHGVWIYLFDELDSLRKADLTKAKNFITARKDHYRPSYARIARDFLRQTVFCGSTNESEYLIDRTGNRRFWPVRVVRPIDVAGIVRDRDQLWAEAVARFDSGERWYADTPELRALCEAEQTDRVQHDPWEPIVAAWLADPKEFAWEEDAQGHPRKSTYPYDASAGVLTGDVLRFALERPAAQLGRADHMRISDILRSLGYERGPQVREDGARVRRFVPPKPAQLTVELSPLSPPDHGSGLA